MRTSPLNAPTTVILLGTDTPIGLGIVRDLGRHGYAVVGIGRHPDAIGGASRYCNHHVVRASGEEALVAQIRDLAAAHGASFLLAISETDLLLLNRHRTRLEETLAVLTAPPDALAKVLDKAVCQSYAASVGIAVPWTMQPAALEEAKSKAEGLSYPVVLKWADPMRVIPHLRRAGLELQKLEYAFDPKELIARLSRFETVGEFPMVQEYCPGHGVGHMFLVKEGEIVIEFQHERIHEWPPEGGASALCRSVPLTEHAEARARSRALLRALDWTGVAMVEYRYDPATKDYRFMEINGRFWGSLPLAIEAGIPFAAGLVAVCGEGRPVPPYAVDYPRLTCCYLIPETKWLLRVLVQPSKIVDPMFRVRRMHALVSYFLRFFRPSTRYFVFTIGDPRPALADAWSVLLKAWSLLIRRRS